MNVGFGKEDNAVRDMKGKCEQGSSRCDRETLKRKKEFRLNNNRNIFILQKERRNEEKRHTDVEMDHEREEHSL